MSVGDVAAAVHESGHAAAVHQSSLVPQRSWISLLGVPGLVLLQVLAYSSQSLLITASKSEATGVYAYDTSLAVLIAEVFKLLAVLVAESRTQKLQSSTTWKHFFSDPLSLAIPAVLYAVHNNLVFAAHVYLPAPTYQLLHKMKIIITGIVYRVLLQRRLLVIQWIALLQLGIGLAVTALSASCPSSFHPAGISQCWLTWLKGATVMVSLSLCSALAGVHIELLRASRSKSHEEPQAPSQVQICSYGVLASAIGVALTAREEGRPLLHGYTPAVWAVVLANSFLGVLVSIVFKHGSNQVKLVGANLTVLVTAAASSQLFSFQPPVLVARLFFGRLLSLSVLRRRAHFVQHRLYLATIH
ncbi:unnamed protein product [Polarella glacialis]|uniref:UDP-galactose transporter n=1 Tax=Polarella glacialis TaxID=89957 RepID=A0A813IB96_POLGL|nr:unnamed protein product [Polarella glacialis]